MKNYGDYGEISIILHMIRKLNSIIFFLYSFRIVFCLKTYSYNMLTSIDVNFIFDRLIVHV